MPKETNPNLISADPTKEFFISMLVKDIELVSSILDLADNCVDGARRLSPDGDYTGLSVRIEANETQFKIADNCGGIPIQIAREYAFRFGRPKEMPSTRHSVGQFGVGMKRALFKLGTKFKIESTSENSRFVIEIDVEEWNRKKEWGFEFSEYEEGLTNVPIEERGTIITVFPIHENVSEDFAVENFQTRILEELVEAHSESIDKGMAFTLNGIPLVSQPLELLRSEELKPAYRALELETAPDSPNVTVKIYAGISAPDPSSAGWYIFCNGRLVIGADQTYDTGWGEGKGSAIPKYHNTFARFRGFVYFDSDDASFLPWNTTKNGVDLDSHVYRSIRLEMINIMGPVMAFLRKLAKEKEEEYGDVGPLEEALHSAMQANLTEVEVTNTFVAPKPVSRPELPSTGHIQYYMPLEKVNGVKRVLKVHTFKAVGEKTFEYFFKMECED